MPITNRQIAVIIFIAVVAGSIPALQPILLGGLLGEHRLTAAQMGQAATIEALGMAIASALASAFLQPTHLRRITILAACGLVLANGITAMSDANVVLVARGINGAASGILLWLLVGMLTRTPSPARLFAIYVTCQAVAAFLLSSIYSAWIVPGFGVTGSYAVLTVLGGVLMLLGAAVPQAYATTAAQPGMQWPTARGFTGLLAVSCYLAGIMSFWVYLTPLAGQLGHSSSSIGTAISLALGVQILGGLAATTLATRLSGLQVSFFSALLSATAVFIAMGAHSTGDLFLGTALFAFFWMFAPPFHLPLLIGFDPSCRSAMFVSSAQLVGMSAGPMIASFSVGEGQFAGAATASIAFFAASAALALAARFAPRQTDPVLL